MSPKVKTGYDLLSLRFGCSVFVFVPLVLYAYVLQTVHDGLRQGGSEWLKVLLFVSVLMIGSVSYDWAKRVLFMDAKSLKDFARSGAALLISSLMYVGLIISAKCLAHHVPTWFIGLLLLSSFAYYFLVLFYFEKLVDTAVRAKTI